MEECHSIHDCDSYSLRLCLASHSVLSMNLESPLPSESPMRNHLPGIVSSWQETRGRYSQGTTCQSRVSSLTWQWQTTALRVYLEAIVKAVVDADLFQIYNHLDRSTDAQLLPIHVQALLHQPRFDLRRSRRPFYTCQRPSAPTYVNLATIETLPISCKERRSACCGNTAGSS